MQFRIKHKKCEKWIVSLNQCTDETNSCLQKININFGSVPESLIKKFATSSPMCLCTGDLNCNLLSDDYESRALLDFCTTFNLTQLINLPTRITESSQSLIGVIMTTNKEIVTSSGVLTLSISDHNLIYLSLGTKVGIVNITPLKRLFCLSLTTF